MTGVEFSATVPAYAAEPTSTVPLVRPERKLKATRPPPPLGILTPVPPFAEMVPLFTI